MAEKIHDMGITFTICTQKQQAANQYAQYNLIFKNFICMYRGASRSLYIRLRGGTTIYNCKINHNEHKRGVTFMGTGLQSLIFKSR